MDFDSNKLVFQVTRSAFSKLFVLYVLLTRKRYSFALCMVTSPLLKCLPESNLPSLKTIFGISLALTDRVSLMTQFRGTFEGRRRQTTQKLAEKVDSLGLPSVDKSLGLTAF